MKNEYLKTLPEGTHEVTVVYKDGECSTNFEIKKVAEETSENSDTASAEEKDENSLNPTTGDNNMVLLVSLFLASFAGMLQIAIYNRKKSLINP